MSTELQTIQPVAEENSTGLMVAVIERAAKDPNVDVSKMERLYEMMKHERAFIAEQKFNRAMCKAQSEMPVIGKDAMNSHTRSKYVLLESLKRQAMPFVTGNGFSLSFSEGDGAAQGKIRVLCDVSHEAGHLRRYHLDLSPDDKGMKGEKCKTGIHGEGSTFSYGERYLIKLIFNITIVGEDTDGNQGRKLKPEGPSAIGGVAEDRVNKRKVVDLTRGVSGVEGYALTEEDKRIINQYLWDESFISPEENLATLEGKWLAAVVAKLEGNQTK